MSEKTGLCNAHHLLESGMQSIFEKLKEIDKVTVTQAKIKMKLDLFTETVVKKLDELCDNNRECDAIKRLKAEKTGANKFLNTLSTITKILVSIASIVVIIKQI